MEKLKISRAVLVEGKYDKMKLSEVLDAVIITTDGFAVFNNEQKKEMLRRIAEASGLVILTDSDPAGFVIRNKLKGILPKDKVINVYAPAIFGKEPRKREPSKAGIIGVEGIDAKVLAETFERYGVVCENSGNEPQRKAYTKLDLYEAGLSGQADSRRKRREYCEKNGLPQEMTANALLEAINLLGLEL